MQFLRNNRIFVKNSVIFKSVCFNKDRAITQNTPKCVEKCSDDQLSYIYLSTYYQFFCNLDYNSENSVFFGQIKGQTLVLGYVHTRGKLIKLGISGRMLEALKSLYNEVKCAVRINGQISDWFDVKIGLKQGCILSPLLFNIFINDLAQTVNNLECGASYGEGDVSILLYADDIVLLSDNEAKLQRMLCCHNDYCLSWGLTINFEKSKIMHFRPRSTKQTVTILRCGNNEMELVKQYKYLGLIFTEFLDLLTMAKTVAKSASRALGLLISKDKAFGGMPFKCYTRCYDALVQATINYGAGIWGTMVYSCIEAVQNRALRYFLGLGKYAPNLAINGDMGWHMPAHRQWLRVMKLSCRMINMDESLLTKQIYIGCLKQMNSKCKSWFYKVNTFLACHDMEQVTRERHVNTGNVMRAIGTKLSTHYESQWKEKLQAEFAVRGEQHGRNKLRTYRMFKDSYMTEPYVSITVPKIYRSAYAKFRCGVAPIKIETCRYGINRIPVNERLCESCESVEDEYHVLMQCPKYDDIRTVAFESICRITPCFTTNISNEDQFIQIMSNPLYYKIVSKAMHHILNAHLSNRSK